MKQSEKMIRSMAITTIVFAIAEVAMVVAGVVYFIRDNVGAAVFWMVCELVLDGQMGGWKAGRYDAIDKQIEKEEVEDILNRDFSGGKMSGKEFDERVAALKKKRGGQ